MRVNFFEEFKRSLKIPEVEEILDIYFFRVLAFLIVKAIYKTRITPNQVTVLAALFGIIGACFYAAGNYVYAVIGALLFGFSTTLDCADGQLARLKGTGTKLGRILDGLSDYVVQTSILLGIGFGFQTQYMTFDRWWVMILLTGISGFIQSSLADYFKVEFLAIVANKNSSTDDEIEEFTREYKNHKKHPAERVLIYSYLKYLHIQRLVTRHKRNRIKKVYDPQDYFDKNRHLMRFWTFLGPSTRISLAIVFSFLYRFDLLLWITIVPLNIFWIILLIFQRYMLSKTDEVIFQNAN